VEPQVKSEPPVEEAKPVVKEESEKEEEATLIDTTAPAKTP